ncbi:MAG: hypothetical protein A2138_19415 [Deltaproteobacteria bacterium RBG_16_71_12]|nr:MAG: hypothetical protein A2138_19415 [Deltaproteobacteria bacterium RBG_16_71_12]
MTKLPHTGKPHGYLLMEVAIGGAMAAVIIAGILTLIADARVKRTAAARDVVASQLVLDKMDDLRNSNPIVAGSDTPLPGYTRSWTANAATAETMTVPDGGIVLNSTEVVVTVTYTSNASSNPVRTATARSRVYQ